MFLEGDFCVLLKTRERMKTSGSSICQQGNRDKEKTFIVSNMSTLRQSSTKFIVSTAAVMKFRVFIHDVKQTYLQSKP